MVIHVLEEYFFVIKFPWPCYIWKSFKLIKNQEKNPCRDRQKRKIIIIKSKNKDIQGKISSVGKSM